MSTTPGFPGSESDAEDQPTDVYPTIAGPPDLSQPDVPPPPPVSSSPGLLTAAQSDRCNNCGAQLAPDQRYCVVCGERRGRARFASAMFSGAPEPAAESGSVFEAAGRPSRYPPGATLVAGVITLLVAMALGILIGHDSSNNGAKATTQPPPHVTVNVSAGTGSGSAGSSTSSGSGSSTSGTSSKSSTSSTKAAKTSTAAAAPSTAATQKATAAASKVLGSSKVKTAAPTVKQGGSCTSGAGCQNGKFTGNFFG